MDTKKIAETLKNLRGDRPAEEVANAMNISVSALRMYERGERVPRDEIKKRFSEFYNRTVGQIFFGE